MLSLVRRSGNCYDLFEYQGVITITYSPKSANPLESSSTITPRPPVLVHFPNSGQARTIVPSLFYFKSLSIISKHFISFLFSSTSLNVYICYKNPKSLYFTLVFFSKFYINENIPFS